MKDTAALEALDIVRRCVDAGRYQLLTHFVQRMDERALFWSDVLAVLDAPTSIRKGGPEPWGRAKWIVAGPSGDGSDLELVCVLDADLHGDWTVFITIY